MILTFTQEVCIVLVLARQHFDQFHDNFSLSLVLLIGCSSVFYPIMALDVLKICVPICLAPAKVPYEGTGSSKVASEFK
jgi:hypothetical protein